MRTVSGVYAPNDVREMRFTPERLTDWAVVARALGREDAAIWNDECQACSKGGNLYLCYGCNLAYHPACSVRPVLARPLADAEEFLCPDCLRDCVEAPSNPDTAAVAPPAPARDQE